MPREVFELDLFGAAVERRYRRMRPEVDAMPWGSLDVRAVQPSVRTCAQSLWTAMAFQEFRSSVACSATLRALLEARAPLDLIAIATRFPLDEIVHTELCARMAMELGGGTELYLDPERLLSDPSSLQAPLLRACELVVGVFCVGEAFSAPMIRGAYRSTRHPLPRAVLRQLMRDEVAHATFGFTFLEWAVPQLEAAALDHIGRHADIAIDGLLKHWDWLRRNPMPDPVSAGMAASWMPTDAYLQLAVRTMEERIRTPLRRKGIPITR